MESDKSYRDHLKAGYDAGNIKVHIPFIHQDEGDPETEHLWARPVTPTTAKVLNIPFFTDAFCLGDLVKHRDGEIVGVIERGALTFRSAFSTDDPDEARVLWPTVSDYFSAHDIHIEWAFSGLFSLAVPRDIEPARLMAIVQACPVTIEGISPPEEHDRF